MHLAKARDINVVVSKASATKGFTNLITVTLKAQNDTEHRFAGTLLNGYGARVVQIDKFPVDISPEGHLIFISHNDKPGIIGNVGTLLGKNDVNIAAMQVGRKVIGGEAIMVLTVDKEAPKEVLDDLTKLPEINKAQQIAF
ncbi:D-3-phosphoglycerate dehydrogenase [compost metagenome]